AKITRHATTGAITGNSQFKHVCGFLKFRFGVSTVKSLVLSSMNDEYLAGTVPVTFSGSVGSETITLGDVTGGSKTITVTPPLGSTTFTSGTQYVVAILGKDTIGALSYKYTTDEDADYYGKITFLNGGLTKGKGYYGNTTYAMDQKGSAAMAALSTTVNSTTQITVGWTNKSTSTAPLKYEISYGAAGTSADAGTKVLVDKTSDYTSAATHAISGLSAGTEYSFYIRTKDKNGNVISGWSAVKNEMTKIQAPAVTIHGDDATHYTVSFTKPTGATSYDISITGGDSETVSGATAESYSTQFSASRNSTGIKVDVTFKNSTYSTANASSTQVTGRCGYFSGGAGTSASPYRISNANDLVDLSKFTYESFSSPYSETPAANTNADNTSTAFRASYYKQTANIAGTSDSKITLDSPIGFSGTYSFTGVYDASDGSGGRYYISYYQVSNTNYVGLFGYVRGNATSSSAATTGIVSNLDCRNFTPDMRRPEESGEEFKCQGAVVGQLYGGKVDNCVYSAGAVTLLRAHAGGIVGWAGNYSTISNCNASVKVTGSAYNTGGIVGSAYDSTISGCTVTGAVQGGGVRTGGVIGYADNTTVTTCSHTTGTVSSAYDHTGGIVGHAYNGSVINGGGKSSGSVTATGGSYVGGIVGCLQASTVQNCPFGGTLTYTGTGQRVGGVVGYGHSSSTIKSCNVTGTVTMTGVTGYSAGRCGGVAGLVNASTIDGCTFSGSVSLARAGAAVEGSDITCNSVGGIAGYAQSSSVVKNCTVNGSASISSTTGYAGTAAFVGKLNASTIQDCSLSAASARIVISSSEGSAVGGYVGQAINTCTLTNCSVTGAKGVEVKGLGPVGGIVGSFYVQNDNNHILTIRHCRFSAGTSDSTRSLVYCTSATPSGSNYAAGGILGGLRNNDATGDSSHTGRVKVVIDNCYVQNQPTIKAAWHSAGAIVGRFYSANTNSSDKSYLNIYNCIVGSCHLAAESSSSVTRLGMVGSVLAPSSSYNVLNIVNSGMYITSMVTAVSTPDNIAAFVGYANNFTVNIYGSATNLDYGSSIKYNTSTSYTSDKYNKDYLCSVLVGGISSATINTDYIVCPISDGSLRWCTNSAKPDHSQNYSTAENHGNVAYLNTFKNTYYNQSTMTGGIGPAQSALMTWTYFNDPTPTGRAYIQWE
ncbi:MAG: fibronectin type III domain-containing protein, partial [Bacteroidales bacterium]|nr:fibronectin type III domain-containing protein [Bacteroidales bacterium]